MSNQHRSPRKEMMAMLHLARDVLKDGNTWAAQEVLAYFWQLYSLTPASTRRRWKCGR